MENIAEGYNLALENAKNHLKVAQLVSSQICYGIANSHLILASEEAIKAYAIFTKKYFPDCQFEGFEKIFKDHRYKHDILTEFSFETKFIGLFFGIAIDPIMNLVMKEEQCSEEDLINARERGIDKLIIWLNSNPKIEYNELWWNSANDNKNNGFYVNKINEKWQAPSSITAQTYNISYKIVKDIIEAVDNLQSFKSSPVFELMYAKMRKEFDKNS